MDQSPGDNAKDSKYAQIQGVQIPSVPVIQPPGPAIQAPGPAIQAPGPVIQAPGPVIQAPGLVIQAPGPVIQPPGTAIQPPGHPQPCKTLLDECRERLGLSADDILNATNKAMESCIEGKSIDDIAAGILIQLLSKVRPPLSEQSIDQIRQLVLSTARIMLRNCGPRAPQIRIIQCQAGTCRGTGIDYVKYRIWCESCLGKYSPEWATRIEDVLQK